MNTNLKYFLQTITVLALVITGIWLKRTVFPSSVSTPEKRINKDTTITIIQYIDSSTHTVNQITPFRYKDSKGNSPKSFDTLAALRTYFSSRTTRSTYRDSNISITVYDTLFANSIAGRSLDYKMLKANTLTTRTVISRRNGWYIGAAVSSKGSLSPSVSYSFKNWQLGASVVRSGAQAIPFINLQYKIR